MPDLAAKLGGKPLSGHLNAGLAAPYAFDGRLDVADWDLSDLLTLVPGAPKPAPADGLLTARATARGTLSPRDLQTGGEGKIANFRAGAGPAGGRPLPLEDRGGFHRRRHPGRPAPSAAGSGRPRQGPRQGRTARSARPSMAKGIDTAEMTALMPDEKPEADGQGRRQARPPRPGEARRGGGAGRGESQALGARPDDPGHPRRGRRRHCPRCTGGRSTTRSSPRASAARSSSRGTSPCWPRPPRRRRGGQGPGGRQRRAPGGRLLARRRLEGDRAGRLPSARWTARRPSAPTSGRSRASGLFARALAEVRDLRWGKLPLGRLEGDARHDARPPGGSTPWAATCSAGTARGTRLGRDPGQGPRPHRASRSPSTAPSWPTCLAFSPGIARKVEGTANVRLAGRVDDGGVHANGEVDIGGAKVMGLPVSRADLPAELALAARLGLGAFHARRFRRGWRAARSTARPGSGSGPIAPSTGKLHLSAIDLETLSRIETDTQEAR